jgi:outer membrane immunogenic protein
MRRSCLQLAAPAAALFSGLVCGVVTASAQVGCPTLPVPPFSTGHIVSGTCVFEPGLGGSFATAALSMSRQSMNTTLDQLSSRRKEELQRCPAGLVQIGGQCAGPTRAMPFAIEKGDGVGGPFAELGMKTAPIKQATFISLPAESAPRLESWLSSFGVSESRSSVRSSSALSSVQANPNNNNSVSFPNVPITVTQSSRSGTVGFVGGADIAFSHIASERDSLLVGLLAGHSWTTLSVNTVSSRNPIFRWQLADSSNTTNAQIAGPTIGMFGTYFNEVLSADLTLKADMLNFSQSSNASVGAPSEFCSSASFGFGQCFAADSFYRDLSIPFSTAGATHLVNYNLAGNLNYRIPVGDRAWIEPTAGFSLVYSAYDRASAELLGLDNGYVFRVLGGVRVQTAIPFNEATLVPTVVVMVYDDAKMVGGAVANSTLSNNTDQGKLRGQGGLGFNVDYGHGLSWSMQGEIYGGGSWTGNVLGVGVQTALNYQWSGIGGKPSRSPPRTRDSGWYGLYVGVNAGAGMGRDATVDTVALQPKGSPGAGGRNVILPAYWNGFPVLSTDTVDHMPFGGGGGGQIGYNLQRESWLVGVEADIQSMNETDSACVSSCLASRPTDTSDPVFDPLFPFQQRTPSTTGAPGDVLALIDRHRLLWFGTMRARLGAAADNWLIYLTGGAAWAKVESSLALVTTPGLTGAGAQTAGTFGHGRLGWTMGAGVERRFGDGWSVKCEYLFANLGTVTDNFATTLVPAVSPFSPMITESTYHITDHIFRLGLNRHLGFGAGRSNEMHL